MDVKVVVSKYMRNNSICISNNGCCIVVDPSFNKEGILSAIGDDKLIGIAITHCHFDHFATADFLVNEFDVPIYAHKNEIKNMRNKKKHLGTHYGVRDLNATNVVEISDGELVDFGEGITLKAIRVEGHTSDSICFYSEQDKFVISGDTVFRGTIGRVDLHQNDQNQLITNIKERILTLLDETVIYCGHGESTDVATEKKRSYYNENIY